MKRRPRMPMRPKPPLWTCPKCGHRFISRNLWHSCRRFPLRTVLGGIPPAHRAIVTHFRALLRACGPVIVYGRRPRTIVFQVRVRFAGLHMRQGWVEAGLWLERRATHPCLHRTASLRTIGSHGYAHYFRFTDVAQLDRAFEALAREAYVVGAQRSRPSRAGA